MTQDSLAEGFAAEVDRWRQRGLGRSLVASPRPSAGAAVDFTSNDYLGLSTHPRIIAAAIQALEAHGASGRASRLLGGGSPETLPVEKKLASWLGAEAALLFPSGYQANLTLLPAIARPGDLIVSDELNHASLIDAMRLSGATVRIVPHGDPEATAHVLNQVPNVRSRWVVTEAVFSMDGDLAPLAELDRICTAHGAGLIVDEAHAAGVLGPAGRGGCAAAGVTPIARIVTGGKALGAACGVVAGSQALIDLLVHRGRGFVFSTAVSPAVVGALGAAIDIVADADAERARVRSHAQTIAAALGAPAPSAAIVPIVVGASTDAVEAQAALLEDGFDVRAVRPPTVPDGTARLRVVCRSAQTDQDIAGLSRSLQHRLGRSACSSASQRMSAGTSEETSEGRSQPRSEGPPRKRPLFVVGTDTDIGKTVVSAVAALAMDARYWKPVQTGSDSDTDEVGRLAGPVRSSRPTQSSSPGEPRAIAAPRYWFALPASPHTAGAAEGASVDLDELETALDAHCTQAAPRRLVVELAGGLLVPLSGESTQADWLARKRLPSCTPEILLVARSGLGTLNHTLLTLESLRARALGPKALVLVGERHSANADTLRPLVPALFELPIFSPLDRPALVEWLQQTGLGAALHD